jgi:hypothetical protein
MGPLGRPVGLFGRPGCAVSSVLSGGVQPVVRLWMSRASDLLFHDQKALVVRNLFVDRPDHSTQGVAPDLGELLERDVSRLEAVSFE